MTLPFISAEDIERRISFGAAIELLATMFSNTESKSPTAREHLPFADGELLVMSAVRNSAKSGVSAAGVKVVTVRNENTPLGLPSVHAVYILCGGEALAPLALIDGAALTALRTAAVSGLATRLLAREDSAALVIFGAGVQAASHLRAMSAVRPIRHVTIVNSNESRAQHVLQLARGMGIEAHRGAPTAVAKADIVCTCTTSSTPVFDGGLLPAGAHVNAIGAYHPNTRELDDATAFRGRWFVEERTRVFDEAGDVLIPLNNGTVGADFVLDDLFGLCGGGAGRVSSSEITVFKSVGTAVEDLAIATAIVGNATP